MLRTRAIFLLLLWIFPPTSWSQEPAHRVLARTEEVYRTFTSCQLAGTIWYEWKDSGGKPRVVQESFRHYQREGGRLRLQRGLGANRILALTNGSESLLYLADLQQYVTGRGSSLESFVCKTFDIENSAWVFPSVALVDRYSSLQAQFHSPKLLGYRDLIVDDRKYSCVIVEGSMDSHDINAIGDNRRTQLWIDKNQYAVRQEISTRIPEGGPATGEAITETITFNAADMNNVPGEVLFALSPTVEAKQVNQLFISGEARPFHYELPFVAKSNFDLTDVRGESVSLRSLRGKYVLLDFWATWCVPCHRQSSDLEKALQQFGGLKLAVLGINDEPVETTRSFLKNRSQKYPWLIDQGGRLGSLFDVKVLPTLVLLDPSGKVILKREQRQNFGQIVRLLNDAGLR